MRRRRGSIMSLLILMHFCFLLFYSFVSKCIWKSYDPSDPRPRDDSLDYFWTISQRKSFYFILFTFFMFCGPLCRVHFFPKYIHRFPPRESMVPSSMDRWEFHIAIPAMSNEWSVDVIWKEHTVHLYTSYMVNFQGHWIIQSPTHEIHGSSTVSTAKKSCFWLILNFHLLPWPVNYLYGYRGGRYELHNVFASKLLWKTREQKTITRRQNWFEL